MTPHTSLHQFASVDAADDPAALVTYLDALSLDATVRAYKRLTFALQRIRRGDHLLDLGCGTGGDACRLAETVGPTGSVVGIDRSETMVAEAQRRRPGALPVEFRVGDAYELDLDDESLDGCRADRVFQHLDDSERALAELIRVCRPGGRIVIADPDWETMVVDADDRGLTRRLKQFFCDEYANASSAQQMPALFGALGLRQVSTTPVTMMLTTLAGAEQLLQLTKLVKRAQAAGSVTASEGAAWLRQLRRADAGHRFFLAFTGFVVAGEKPPPVDIAPP